MSHDRKIRRAQRDKMRNEQEERVVTPYKRKEKKRRRKIVGYRRTR